MDILSPKQIAEIAKSCRKAGILTFKGYGVEFTLDPKKEPKVAKQAPKQTAEPATIQVQGPNGPMSIPAPKVDETSPNEIPNDSPTAEQLLYWSVGDENVAS